VTQPEHLQVFGECSEGTDT